MIANGQFREREVQIARYRLLEREVTDPLAASLLHEIVQELERGLEKDREIGRGEESPARSDAAAELGFKSPAGR
jgi:hypothetical protein